MHLPNKAVFSGAAGSLRSEKVASLTQPANRGSNRWTTGSASAAEISPGDSAGSPDGAGSSGDEPELTIVQFSGERLDALGGVFAAKSMLLEDAVAQD